MIKYNKTTDSMQLVMKNAKDTQKNGSINHMNHFKPFEIIFEFKKVVSTRVVDVLYCKR